MYLALNQNKGQTVRSCHILWIFRRKGKDKINELVEELCRHADPKWSFLSMRAHGAEMKSAENSVLLGQNIREEINE